MLRQRKNKRGDRKDTEVKFRKFFKLLSIVAFNYISSCFQSLVFKKVFENVPKYKWIEHLLSSL